MQVIVPLVFNICDFMDFGLVCLVYKSVLLVFNYCEYLHLLNVALFDGHVCV